MNLENGPSDVYLGGLFVVSAPSGAGKTSLVKALAGKKADIMLSVSHTTRLPRATEIEGIDYHFIDRDKFLSMKAAGEFLEHAEVFGNYYGTSSTWVDEQLALGKSVILEIDVQGAQQIRNMRECTSIFVLPASLSTLENRLRGRGQDSEEVISARLAEAVSEMSHYQEFDFLVINDIFEIALADLTNIVNSVNLRTVVQRERHACLLGALLNK
tara:strand:+ start:229 stop:870 length:642 start_codon:yes stop_codon:yes gene_type:complete